MSREERSPEMDAVTACLERGWDLLERGDLVGARVSAHQILQLGEDSPEAHTLLGAVAAAEGDLQEALELLRQAMDLDPGNLEAMLYAAEVAVLRDEHDQALELCAQARELCRDPEEQIDLALLLVEALIAAGRMPEAKRAAAALPALDSLPAQLYFLRAGRVWLELGEAERAEALLRQAAAQADSEADARYYLGLALDAQGRGAEAVEQFLLVCDLDRRQPDPVWAYSAEDFEALLRATLAGLPPELAEPMSRVPFRVLSHPPLELVAEGLDPRAMLYLAGARPEPPEAGQMPRAPAPIVCGFVYKRPLERLARSGAGIAVELRAALEEEARAVLCAAASDTEEGGGA